jgi:hypothetical protein
MNLIGYNKTWGENQIDRSTITSKKSQAELEKRRMTDSYAEAIIPLGKSQINPKFLFLLLS